MVRNLVIIGGSSNPEVNRKVCEQLGIPPGEILLSKFSAGETQVEIKESVRGKDVYSESLMSMDVFAPANQTLVIQSSGGQVNDDFMELLICISAAKLASARKVCTRQIHRPYTWVIRTELTITRSPLSCHFFHIPVKAKFRTTRPVPHLSRLAIALRKRPTRTSLPQPG